MAHLPARRRAVGRSHDGGFARRSGAPRANPGARGQRRQRGSLASRGTGLMAGPATRALVADDVISKPFRVRELLARVEAHIRVGRALAQAREEARSRAAMVDILHEVTDSLKPDEMYHILARRVARALNISKCSMVLAKPGD